jgi:Mn2+/Fe2+ NRAMP family transporter
VHHADHGRHAGRARHHRHQFLGPGRASLRPIAGDFAFALFSLGIIGTGLLAVPVLAGSAAYAMAGAMHWRGSLELQYGRRASSTASSPALR